MGAHVHETAQIEIASTPRIMTTGVTLELVLNQLRRCHFAVLSTTDAAGTPHSAGVNYGLSNPSDRLAIYFMTRRHLQKARDIAQSPNVSLVVPVPRPLLWFIPPATMQRTAGPRSSTKTTPVELTSFISFGWAGES
jgi:pyridoxamine 5'-phosphate oxidase-like protein